MPLDPSALIYCVSVVSVAAFCAADVEVYLFWVFHQLLCKPMTGNALGNIGFALGLASTFSKYILTIIKDDAKGVN